MGKEELMKILAKYVREPEYVIFDAGSVWLINTSPHELVFEDDSRVDGSRELAEIIKATPEEKKIASIGDIELVSTKFRTEEKAEELIGEIMVYNEQHPEKPALFVSSIISAQVYGFPVVSPIAVNPRAPPKERKVYKKKFNVF